MKKTTYYYVGLLIALLVGTTSVFAQTNVASQDANRNTGAEMVPVDTNLLQALSNATTTRVPTGTTVLDYNGGGVAVDLAPMLTSIGFTVTSNNSINPGDLATAIAAQPYDLVIARTHSTPTYNAADITALTTYIANGGKVIFAYWQLSIEPALLTAFEIATAIDYTVPTQVNAWDVTHPIFTTPNAITNLVPNGNDPWNVDGARMEPSGTALALGGFTPAATPGEAGIILGNGGNTFVNGFTSVHLDLTTYINLIENEAEFLFAAPQEIIQQDAVLTACADFQDGDIYTDSAGSAGNYSSNELSTLELVAQPGETVSVTFTAFDVEASTITSCFDNLTVVGDVGGGDATYAGDDNDAGAGLVCTDATDPAGNPTLGPFTSAPGGSLSFTFDSDGSVTQSGWEAVITLSAACPVGSGDDPVITCPADITINNTPGECSGIADFTGMAIDTEDGDISGDIVATPASGSVFPVGTTSVTLSVTDSDGNTSTCMFDVTVVDNEAPMIVCNGSPSSEELMVNGSFETSDFTGWTAIDNPLPFIPWQVANVLGDPALNLPDASPTDGAWLAGNGFDGAAGVALLFQDIAIPVGATSTTMSWDENIDYDLQTFCVGCIDRIYEVQVRDLSDNVLEVLQTVDAIGGTLENDNVWNSLTANLSAYAGQSIRITFWQNIPESNTGSARFAVDNVSVIANTTSPGSIQVILDEFGNGSVNVADLFDTASDNCGIATVTAGTGTGGTSGSLTTTFAGGNGIRSMMFDVNALEDATIDSFEVNLDDSAVLDIEVYAKTGTHVGSENTPGDWTLIGTAPGVVSAGDGLPTPLNLALDYAVMAGQTYAFYISSPNKAASLGFNYTNGTNVGDVFAADATIEILEGVAVSYPFGTIFSPRVFNGTVEYTAGTGGGSSTTIDFDCDDVGENQIEVTATDVNGNVATCIATVEVIDNIDPILVCQDFTLELGADGTAMLDPMDLIDMTNTIEACGIEVTGVDMDDFSCDDIGTPQIITLFVSDPSGNLASCEATVTVVDLLRTRSYLSCRYDCRSGSKQPIV